MNTEEEQVVLEHMMHQHRGVFDNELYLACQEYLLRHESLHRVKGKIAANTRIPAEEWVPMSLRQKANNVLKYPFRTNIGKMLFAVQSVLIVLTVVSIVFESIPAYNPIVFSSQRLQWLLIDAVVTIYFTVEIVVRFWASARRKYFFTKVIVWCDIIAIVPFYVEIGASEDQRRLLATMKIFRMVRMVRFAKYIDSIQTILIAVRKSLHALVAPVMFLIAALFIASGALYYAERGTYDPTSKKFMIQDCRCESSSQFYLNMTTCPKLESKFQSISSSMWLVVVTMSTVGYGDMYAVCGTGMLLSSLTMLLASLLVSMPIAIISTYYTDHVEDTKRLEKEAKGAEANKAQAAAKRKALETQGQYTPPRPPGDESGSTAVVIASPSPPRGERSPSGLGTASPLRPRHPLQSLSDEKAMRMKTVGGRMVAFLRAHLRADEFSISDPPPIVHYLVDSYLIEFFVELSKAKADQVQRWMGEIRTSGVFSGVGTDEGEATRTMGLAPDSTFPIVDERGDVVAEVVQKSEHVAAPEVWIRPPGSEPSEARQIFHGSTVVINDVPYKFLSCTSDMDRAVRCARAVINVARTEAQLSLFSANRQTK